MPRGAVDYATKMANKAALIAKVEELGGETCVLGKREIENYYCRAAIQRVIGDAYVIPEEFLITDYSDIKEDIKSYIIAPSRLNFKAKNNFDVFENMTRDEWIGSGYIVGDTTDLQIIIAQILN